MVSQASSAVEHEAGRHDEVREDRAHDRAGV